MGGLPVVRARKSRKRSFVWLDTRFTDPRKHSSYVRIVFLRAYTLTARPIHFTHVPNAGPSEILAAYLVDTAKARHMQPDPSHRRARAQRLF